MKKIYLNAALMISCLFMVAMQSKAQKSMRSLIDENMKLAAVQYKYLAAHLPANRMPKTYFAANNKWENSDTKWWCSGFYPGSLWLIYEQTGDKAIREEAEKRLALLEPEKHYTGNHDLGFMMFCSFGTAYRITGDARYKPAIDTAAMSLASRYRPIIRSIQSWDSGTTFKCPVIIDNMMNLELLYWVSDHGGDKRFRDIAIAHTNSTIANHFRPDYSSYHVIDYDLRTGKLLKKMTWQGAADNSAWSRGQSWGLYGFTVMYRFSKDQRYLGQARNIAQFLLNHPNMPADLIPYWDFNAPNIPNALRDASAASVMASALLELAQFTKGKERKQYLAAAEKIIRVLSSDTYRAEAETNGGFLLKHSVGAMPFKSEVDVPLTYADYYFLEAMQRYKMWVLDGAKK